MLHKGLSQLVTMVIFFCLLSLLFPRTDHPPQKNTQWRDKSCDFRSNLAVCISDVIHVADLILRQHHSCPLIIQMHTRTNVCYASLKFYIQTWKAYLVSFSKLVKLGILKFFFLKGPGRYKCSTNC